MTPPAAKSYIPRLNGRGMSFSLTQTAREKLTLEAYQSPERPTQAELALRFGVSQPAIAQRLARARAKVYGRRLDRPEKRIHLRPISLSLCPFT